MTQRPDGRPQRAALWTEADLPVAAEALLAGGLVAFPTETVYGLGVRADDPAAVARLYAAKGRPRFNPLIAHVVDLGAAEALAELPAEAMRLATAFWPGPLTLVAPRRPGGRVCDLAAAGLATVGVRVPAHPVALALLRAVGVPLAAPSANPSGRVSPTTAAHVMAGLAERIDGVLEGGPCTVGVESTIIGFDPAPVLLRPGGVTAEALEAVLGHALAVPPGSRITAPGQLASHYAPGARLRLGATAPRKGEGWLGFGPDAVPAGTCTRSLSARGDLEEAAANLFGHLRALDSAMGGTGTIAVAAVPDEGLGRAINDRLRRAAAPREEP